MIFRCEQTKEEIVELLKHPQFEDNIKYDFTEEKEGYCLAVTRIPFQIGKRKPFPYGLVFIQGTNGLYLQVEAMKKSNTLLAASHEPELYRFFIERCHCEPVGKIE